MMQIMEIAKLIDEKIAKVLKTLGVKNPEMTLEHPADLSLGDYASNAAIAYSKQLGVQPIEIARAIVEEFNNKPLSELARVEIAGFGFVNFYLSNDYLIKELKVAASNPVFGQNKNLAGEKIIIDYTDPNPFKEFHIGHLMTNAIGEVVSRLFEASGAEVKRVCYQGDVGLHIAKTIYGLRQLTFKYYLTRYFGTIKQGAKFLGEAYAQGAKAYEENEEVKAEIIKINNLIYSRANNQVNNYYDWGRKVSLKYFDQIYKVLDTKFDYFFFESETAPVGLEIVKREKVIFKDSQGAIVFPGEDYGLHTRVFVNSQGLPTYEAKELALFEKKKEIYDFTKSYSVAANEQSGFFAVVKKVVGLLYPKIGDQFFHISHGLLKLPSGKMSSRTGDVIAATSLIETVVSELRKQFDNKHIDQATMTQIAVGAIKFAILRQAPGKDIIFDFNKSLSFDGDSGPYLAYAHARARSVLQKAKSSGFVVNFDQLVKVEELPTITRLLYRLPEVVSQATKEIAPQLLIVYLLNLAAVFNRFYNEQKIIDENNQEATQINLLITAAFAEVLKTGLTLLSISTPSRM